MKNSKTQSTALSAETIGSNGSSTPPFTTASRQEVSKASRRPGESTSHESIGKTPETQGRKNMPKKLEAKLKREAGKAGLKGERKNAYVYGTMRKTGWKPARERKGGK
jgi:hypothetical protein